MQSVEMDAKELFLGLAMVLHSTGSNIKEGKMGFDEARALYIDVLQEHSDEEMIAAAKKMGELLTEVAKDQNISIS